LKNAILIRLGLLLMVLSAGNAVHFYRLRFVDCLPALIFDYRLRIGMPRTIDDRIQILDIDEQSLDEEGRWRRCYWVSQNQIGIRRG